jgi:hypothetical protein
MCTQPLDAAEALAIAQAGLSFLARLTAARAQVLSAFSQPGVEDDRTRPHHPR